VTDEVLENNIFDVAAATVRLDHHHLVRFPGVDVLVYNGGDGGVSTERAHGAAATPVTVDVLDQDIFGRRLYGDALVFVSHHDIMYPAVGTGDINTVETTPVASADRHIVGFAVCAIVDYEVEHGCVNKNDVVDSKVGRFFNAKKTGAISLAVLVVLITIACNCGQHCDGTTDLRLAYLE